MILTLSYLLSCVVDRMSKYDLKFLLAGAAVREVITKGVIHPQVRNIEIIDCWVRVAMFQTAKQLEELKKQADDDDYVKNGGIDIKSKAQNQKLTDESGKY